MQRIDDHRRIQEMMTDKKKNEISMAKELWSKFNKEPLLSIIQSVANCAIADLLRNANERELGRYLNDNPRRLFWTKEHIDARFVGGPKPDTFIDQFKAIKEGQYRRHRYQTPPHRQFVATDCSDVLLLYAEFIEGCADERKNPYPKSKKKYTKTQKGWIFKDKIWSHAGWIADRRKIRGEQQIQPRDRTGFGRHFYPKKHDMVTTQKTPKGMHSAFEAEKYQKKIDDFTKKPDETDEDYKDRVIRERQGLPSKKVRVRRKHTDEEQEDTLELLKSLGITIPKKEISPGMMFWKLLDESSLMQIDRMFGLKELGADISGTTADTVGALEALYTDLLPVDRNGNITPIIAQKHQGKKLSDAQVTENLLLLRPLISLLPLATMVSLGHHTTLECAYVLSRNEYINYSIGYYTSLFPSGWYELTETDDLNYQKKIQQRVNIGGDGPPTKLFHPVVKDVAEDIWTTLLKYESHKDNHKMMIYYSKEREIKGAFMITDTQEEKRFRNAATLSENIDTYLQRFYTTKERRYPDLDLLITTGIKHDLFHDMLLAHASSWEDLWDDEEVELQVDEELEDKYELDDDDSDYHATELREERRPSKKRDVSQDFDDLLGGGKKK
jgi:hypothetical protein